MNVLFFNGLNLLFRYKRPEVTLLFILSVLKFGEKVFNIVELLRRNLSLVSLALLLASISCCVDVLLCQTILDMKATYKWILQGMRSIIFLVFLILLPFENTIKSQSTNCTKYLLISFKAICAEGKVYTSWVVKEPEADCLYLLERSLDGEKYDVLFSKQGAISPQNNDLLHCYVDTNPITGISYYRMRRFSGEGCISSQVVKIINKDKGQRQKSFTALLY